MGQVQKLARVSLPGPDRLGHIDDYVASVLPRSEDADLRLTSRTNGLIEKADPRVTAARIGPHNKRIVFSSLRRGHAIEAKPVEGPRDLAEREAGGRFDLGRDVTMENRHVFEPVPQVDVVRRPPEVDGRLARRDELRAVIHHAEKIGRNNRRIDILLQLTHGDDLGVE